MADNRNPRPGVWYNTEKLPVTPIAVDDTPSGDPPAHLALRWDRVKHLRWTPAIYSSRYETGHGPRFSSILLDADPDNYSFEFLHNLLAYENAASVEDWADMFHLLSPWFLAPHDNEDDITRLQLSSDEVARIRKKDFPVEHDPATVDGQECTICCTNVGTQRLDRNGQLHDCRFCRYCFRIMLQKSMQGQGELTFPGRCCAEGSQYSLEDVVTYGDSDLILLFRHCMIKKLSLPAQEVPCFHCGEDIESSSWNTTPAGQGQCEFCLHSTCVGCGEQTHSNGYMGYGRDRPCRPLSIEEKEARLDTWRQHDALGEVPCPMCGLIISRTEGCVHLKCVCHTSSFCLVCGGAWGSCACHSYFTQREFWVPIEYRIGNKPLLSMDERMEFCKRYPIHCMPQFGDHNIEETFPQFDPLDRYWGRFHWKNEWHSNIPEQRAYFIKYVMPRDARDARLGLHHKGDMLRLLPRRSRWRIRTTHMIDAFDSEVAVDPNTPHRFEYYPAYLELFDAAEGVLEELSQAGKLEGEPSDTSDLPLDESSCPKIPCAKVFALDNPYIERNLRKTRPGRRILRQIVERVRQHNRVHRGLELRRQDDETCDRHARAYEDHMAGTQRIAIQDYFNRYEDSLEPYDPASDELPFPPSPLVPYNPSLQETRRGFTGVESSEQQFMRRATILDERTFERTQARRVLMDNEFDDNARSGHVAFPIVNPYIPGESDHRFHYSEDGPFADNRRQWAQFEDPQDEWRRMQSGR